MNMFITVIVPLYNKKEFILNTINSVLNQSYPNYELVIVDDGSTDGGPEIVSEIQNDHIRLIKQPNGGVSSARNRGVREAQYELIAFLDADDYWEPNYLEEMVAFIRAFPEAGIYGCAYDDVINSDRLARNFFLPAGFKGIVDNYFQHACKNHLFWTSAVVIRKSVFIKSGTFDERISMGEDIDLWFRIAYSFPVAFYNSTLAHYNFEDNNRASKKKHNYSSSFLCYIDKYSTMEGENPDFRCYINLLRIRKLPEVFFEYNLSKAQINVFLNSIDSKGQKWSHRLFLKTPFAIKRTLIRCLFFNKHINRFRIKRKRMHLQQAKYTSL